MTIFAEGQTPSLQEVLFSRENRVRLQTRLLTTYPQGTLISYKCNIPGAVKNNAVIQKLFGVGKEELETVLSSLGKDILYYKELNLKTGPECFIVVNDSPGHIKKSVIEIEEKHTIGRLFDIDVLYESGNGIKSFSRVQMNKPLRKCLICSKDAKSCGRNRTHSLEEIHIKMESIIEEDERISL